MARVRATAVDVVAVLAVLYLVWGPNVVLSAPASDPRHATVAPAPATVASPSPAAPSTTSAAPPPAAPASPVPPPFPPVEPPSTAPPPAPPTTAAPTTAPPPAPAPAASATAAEKGAAALASIAYPWPRTGFAIEFHPGRSGFLGLLNSTTKTISIYVRDDESTSKVARVIAHELGHAVDLTFLTDAEQAQYRQIRGLDRRGWYTCNGCTDFSSPAGDFAEVFTWWLLGPGSFNSVLGPPPDAAQLAQLAPLFQPN